MVAPAVPLAFTMGNALTGLGTGLALAQGTHTLQRVYGYITSDGNGGSVFVPEMPGSSQAMAMPGGLQISEPIFGQIEEKKKKKRKVSKYQKEFGKQMKKLKAKHPRTPVTRLMKRAHTATKKAMKRRRR